MASCAVTTTNVEKWFKAHNDGKPNEQQIRPFGFFITPTVRAFDVPIGRGDQPFHLVAPFESDGAEWLAGTYVDIYTGKTYAISTETYDERTALVQTYRQIATAYIRHPDAKRLAPDGHVCGKDTTGLLSPRHIDAFHIEQLGKEANPRASPCRTRPPDRRGLYPLPGPPPRPLQAIRAPRAADDAAQRPARRRDPRGECTPRSPRRTRTA
jgi:hypothetical protein